MYLSGVTPRLKIARVSFMETGPKVPLNHRSVGTQNGAIHYTQV